MDQEQEILEIASAADVGTLFDSSSFSTLAYVGDDDGTSSNSDDVDLYGVRLVAGQSIRVTATPHGTFDSLLRIFADDGTEQGIPENSNGAGVA